MRILAVSLPAYGHLHPMVPLLIALRDAGHDVLVATGPEVADVVSVTGLPLVAAAPDFGRAMQDAAAAHPDLVAMPPEELAAAGRGAPFGATLFADLLARQGRELLEPVLADLRPDAVLYEETAFGGLLAARSAGLPAACHTLGSRMFPGPFGVEMRRRLTALLDAEALRSPLDLRGDVCVDLCPPSLRAHEPPAATTVDIRPEPWNAPVPQATVRRRASRPLVYLTLGTVVFGAVDVLRAAVDGLSRLELDVLVTVGPSGDPAALGAVPDSVQVERFVDQRQVLRHADLVVSHGGSGTVLGALVAGSPQLALPTGPPDQFRNAAALVASGAGLRLLPSEVGADAVSDAARRLLGEPSYRAAARRLHDEIAGMPAPAEAAERLVAELGRLRSAAS